MLYTLIVAARFWVKDWPVDDDVGVGIAEACDVVVGVGVAEVCDVVVIGVGVAEACDVVVVGIIGVVKVCDIVTAGVGVAEAYDCDVMIAGVGTVAVEVAAAVAAAVWRLKYTFLSWFC